MSDDELRGPASHDPDATRVDGGEGADRTRTLRDDDLGEATPGARPPRPRTADVPSVDETLVSPAMRRRVEAEARPAYRGEGEGQVLRRERGTQTREPRRQPAPRGYAEPYDDRGGYVQPEPARAGRRPERHGGAGRATARTVLLFLSWVFRLAALVYAALVVVDSFTFGNRLMVLQLTSRATELLPSSLAGLYVLDTPFGGAFRGDFAIASVALFVLDWICARIRRGIR